jgi:hypothetical protein
MASWRRVGSTSGPSLTGGEARWIWALNGVPAGPQGIRLAGVTGTLDEAEAELKKSWEQWLLWASLSDAWQQFKGSRVPLSV